MKKLFKEHPILFILIGVGILFSAISFIYKYVINYENLFLSILLMSIDVILLLINIFYLSYLANEKIGKSVINSIIFSLLYFVGITGVILCYAEGNAGVVLMLDILEVLVYLAPNIVILLPIIYLLCLALG